MMLAMLFGIPCCFLLQAALSAPLVPPYLIQFIAILCIPAMGLLTVLFGFSVFEKTFDLPSVGRPIQCVYFGSN
jgi:hypothetical protein